jgi:hypothetical protein
VAAVVVVVFFLPHQLLPVDLMVAMVELVMEWDRGQQVPPQFMVELDRHRVLVVVVDSVLKVVDFHMAHMVQAPALPALLLGDLILKGLGLELFGELHKCLLL